MPYDAVDRSNVEEMVRDFYAQVLKDEMLGPIFVKKLGTDINGARWYEHLQTLYNFWMLMMTGERGYGGHPFPSHAFLGPLTPETFARWLELFHGTVHRYYELEIADKFYKKADMFATQFMDNLGLNDDDDDNC
jgi:hemoglobin